MGGSAGGIDGSNGAATSVLIGGVGITASGGGGGFASGFAGNPPGPPSVTFLSGIIVPNSETLLSGEAGDEGNAIQVSGYGGGSSFGATIGLRDQTAFPGGGGAGGNDSGFNPARPGAPGYVELSYVQVA